MILVTGATGFLGAELVTQLLQKEALIRCIKREKALIPEKLKAYQDKIDWVIADILDLSDLADAMEGISQVYHCAALVSFDPALKAQMMATNTQGTANIVDLCLGFNIQKIVYVSSIAALGEGKADEMIDETHFWDGFETHDAYAVSKYRAEMEVWRGINEGLNAVIVNPSIIIGKDAGKSGSGALFEKVKQGLKYYPIGGSGFVDVEDVAKIMILLMQSTISEERFVINSENYLYKNFIQEIAIALDIQKPAKALKPWMLTIVWRMIAIKNLFSKNKGGLTKSTAKSASKISQFNNAKIKAQFDIEFKPLQQSITEITNCLKSA